MKIPVIDLKECDRIPLYIDGADEANSHKELIKGGGGALTREKISVSAKIPIAVQTESLNVSNAAAIALYVIQN